jgi:glycine/D-amino acid oxidase-like deaminating enzyme
MGDVATLDCDVAVIGAGLVGSTLALGLSGCGQRVALLDEGDAAVRASRANFGLVWVQSKGLGLPQYAGWSIRSSNAWGGFAASLANETGINVSFERPGGFHLALSVQELETRAQLLNRLHNQPGVAAFSTEMIERKRLEAVLPGLGRDVVGASYCALDGHCNSLQLHRALHTALFNRGVNYLPSHPVTAIEHGGGAFLLRTSRRLCRAGKVVIAAGNASARLAPMVGLRAPMRPNRGQIIVTERVERFLHHPIVTIRQTDEGTVMIGDSQLEGSSPDDMTMPVNAAMAARAIRSFPLLGRLNAVRIWSGVRVMTQDGFPIYDQSETCAGAFVVCCHSGVTLAANHALTIAPMIAEGRLDTALLSCFSARRFDVRQAA